MEENRSELEMVQHTKSFRIAPIGNWQARPFTDRFGNFEAEVFYLFSLVQGGNNVLLPTRCVDESYGKPKTIFKSYHSCSYENCVHMDKEKFLVEGWKKPKIRSKRTFDSQKDSRFFTGKKVAFHQKLVLKSC